MYRCGGSEELSLPERVFRSRIPIVLPFPQAGRPPTYKSYDPVSLERAYESVRSGTLSVRRAAEVYNVPRSTLHDHVSGRVIHGASSGPTRYLTDIEEEELVNFLVGCASIGFGRTRKDVIALVQQVVNKKGLKATVTQGWWESFKKRHREIVLRVGEPLSMVRSSSSSYDTLTAYFELLEHTLKENDLLQKPCQIFNTDETGMPLDPPSPLVAACRGQHHPQTITSGNRNNITVLSCCSAGGTTIPPLVIFDRKALKAELTKGEVPGTMYGLSDNGWIDAELFDLWFKHQFLAYAPPTRPLLLLLDGHSSHYNPSTINTAADEEVIIFCLPPHTTHLTQPLDKGCFSPLKSIWKEECHRYMTANPGKVVTRFEFCQLFSRAWFRGMTMENIISGFRCTGIYPFNPDALLRLVPGHQSPSRFDRTALSRRSGLSFIPLYTPIKSPAPTSRSTVHTVAFTQEQIVRYQRRYEEAYDLPDDDYQRWKDMYHPNSPHLSPCSVSKTTSHLPPSTALSGILSTSNPQIQYPKEREKTSARVLTSKDHIELMEAKEKRRRKKQRQRKRD